MLKLSKWQLVILTALVLASIGLTTVAAAVPPTSAKVEGGSVMTACEPWQGNVGDCCQGYKWHLWRVCMNCYWQGSQYICYVYVEHTCTGYCPI